VEREYYGGVEREYYGGVEREYYGGVDWWVKDQKNASLTPCIGA
jgi:hypothetical protein